MEEEARRQGKLLSYGFHFRHSEHVRFLKEKADRGEFGTITILRYSGRRRRGIPDEEILLIKECRAAITL